MEFKNKVFAVTGGANGIGRDMVLQLLQKGAKVAVIDISDQALNETKEFCKEYADNISLHNVDITKKELVEALPNEIINKFGQIDGVFNVAGIIQPFITVNNLTYDKIERVMNVNFYGTLYMVKAFLPHLLNRRSECCIANVSSMGGFLPVPGQSVYGASKAAVKLMTEGLYAELKDTNVRVSIIFPGAVATNITQNSGLEHKTDGENTKAKQFKMLSSEKAAQIILDGVEKEKFRIIVGKDSKFMDILYRLNPKRAVHLILKNMSSLLNK